MAAIRAARLGLRTVLFEEDQVGGVCLNRGCIPTKALLKSSGLCWELRHGEEHGLPACTGPVDFPRTAARRDAVVSRLVSGVQGLLKGSGVEMVRSRAELCENRRIEAAGSVWEAENVILAMGSSPVLPEQTEGKAVSSDALVRADTLPASVVIVGGGVIGVEFADMLAGFGSAVTVVELTDRLLPAADPDVSAAVRAGLEEKGVTVLCGARVTEYRAGEVVCEAEGGTRTLRARLFWCRWAGVRTSARSGSSGSGSAAPAEKFRWIRFCGRPRRGSMRSATSCRGRCWRTRRARRD